MGLFRLFRPTKNVIKETEKNLPWIQLDSVQQLEEIKTAPNPVLIFKHSTRCGVSRAVLRLFEKNFDLEKDQITLYFLDLLAHRNISNEVAKRFQVHHESPQILLIKGGKTLYHTSHHGINPKDLRQYLDK